MMSLWMIFIHLKGIDKLGFKLLDVAKPIETEFFPWARPKKGESSH
jgi:hypothetical protein